MTLNSIRITFAEISNLKEIITLFVETINTVCAKDYSPEQRAVWTEGAQHPERLEKKLETQYFLVARIEEKLAGFASLENNYIDYLFVHKDFQGLGIAKQLYAALLRKAIETNVETLTTNVSLTTRPFFETMGFEVIRKQDNPTRGVNLTNFMMEKRLEKEPEIEPFR
ncbi:GNAT family N-acetyltransferase [Draconibacterium mangrovi]|uniref:GNAT family N-acetyltransferase n=1 Tax=Draconibacterium mangrovi TaxID=2697469 RepID=UPI0013D31F9F|nr:GNAT family N-acetyltransferase [Draconibacterium mangrovi]